MNNALVIGFGEGIGSNFASLVTSFDKIYAVSRTPKEGAWDIEYIQGNVKSELDFSDVKKGSISLLVYVPSLYGESLKLTTKEYEDFMTVGPSGFLKVFESLHKQKLLSDNALAVSIGSTASESASNPLVDSSQPIYSIAKLTQKALTIQLAKHYRQYRFANITLGSIAGEDTGVGYQNIVSSIQSIYTQQKGIQYTDIQLYSKQDI